MQTPKFNEIMNAQIDRCEDILIVKAREYAPVDRLHNFRAAAMLQGTTTTKALAGMMSKHTVSIYDMIETEQPYPEEVWNEKITDHMNYLILLRALVEEHYISKTEKVEEDQALVDGETE